MIDENVLNEENEESIPYSPIVDESVEEVQLDPYEVMSTFKIDENMPDELKQQLEKFNRQTENLNNIMTGNIEDDSEYANTLDDDLLEEESDEVMEEDNIIEDEESEEIGDLF